MVTPFIGTAHDSDTHDGVRSVYGASALYWPAQPIGLEVDFGFHHDFFSDEHPDGDHHVVGDLSTLSVNAILNATFGGQGGPSFRPYITGGFTLFQVRADEPSSLFDARGNDAGFNVGGGAIVLLHNHFGIRGDVRFLKDPRESIRVATLDPIHGTTVAFEAFSFTRATVGFVLRF